MLSHELWIVSSVEAPLSTPSLRRIGFILKKDLKETEELVRFFSCVTGLSLLFFSCLCCLIVLHIAPCRDLVLNVFSIGSVLHI